MIYSTINKKGCDKLNGMAERLLKLMEQKKLTHGALSGLTGISRSALQRYSTGEVASMPCDKMLAIAKALETTPAEMLGLDMGEEFAAVAGTRVAPIITSLFATANRYVHKKCEGFAPLVTPMPSAEYYYYIVRDDTMHPMFQKNDMVLVKAQTETREDEYALVMVIGSPQAMIRRVVRTHEMVILAADNLSCPPKVLPDANKDFVLTFGKIVSVNRRLD